VLSNLINNAVEAISDTGKIVIELSLIDSFVELKVIDNGCGISQELLSKVFRGASFGKVDGSGLGLPHAKQTIEHFKGDIRIDSVIGEGTVVTLHIPKAGEPEWFADHIDIDYRKGILVLDDDRSIHDAWDERLQGFKKAWLKHFMNPEAFLNWQQNHDDGEFLLLSDYEFIGQRLNGLDVIEKSKVNKAILVTSHFEDINLLKRCKQLNVKILPKSLSGYILIKGMLEDDMVDLIFLDDNEALTQAWELAASFANKSIKTYQSAAKLMEEIDHYDKSTPIYVDSDLNESLTGEDVTKALHEKGFHELYIASGYEPSKFKHCTWIKKVVGKTPPFDF
jgi:FixJ family two-component response regulator